MTHHTQLVAKTPNDINLKQTCSYQMRRGFKSRGGWAGAGLRDEQGEGHHYEPGQAGRYQCRIDFVIS